MFKQQRKQEQPRHIRAIRIFLTIILCELHIYIKKRCYAQFVCLSEGRE